MRLEEVIQELIQRLGSGGDTILAWEQVREWPKGAIDIFQKTGWIVPTVAASTVECPGCDRNCFMPAHVLSAQNEQRSRAYVACDKLDNMGRVKIAMCLLQRWQVTEAQIARWVSSALGLKGKIVKNKAPGHFTLGNLQGKNRLGSVQFVSAESVLLKVSGHSRPLSDFVFFKNEQPSIDRAAILDLVDFAPASESTDRYQRSTARREAGKLDTLARRSAWQKAYKELRRKRPGMSDVWYSQQIGKQLSANGETIRKHMKK